MLKKFLDRIAEGKLFFPTLADVGGALVGPWGSKENPLIDPNVMASAAGVLTPTFPITRVSGTAAITGITVPYAGFHGPIYLIPTGAFTWTTATNIAVAGTAVVGKVITLVYDPYAAKWYPSY